jgi:hypothetical protein
MHQFLKFILGMKFYTFRTVPLSIIRSFDKLTSNISFIRVPKTEKCDVTESNETHQSANSRRGHLT